MQQNSSFYVIFWVIIICSFAVISAAEQPNILLILADDIGWGDLSCYNNMSRIKTPELDKLAATGVRFTSAHSPAALCSPTRYAMLTGNYPWRGRDPEGTWSWYGPTQFLSGQKTIGHFLQQAGYRTAMFGKAGIGITYERMLTSEEPDFTSKLSEGPVQWGFDYSYIIPRGHQICPYVYYENNTLVGDPSKIVTLEQDSHLGKITGPGIADWNSTEIGHTLMNKAIAFLDNHLAQNKVESKERPFLIYFNTDGAHVPYTPPENLFGHPLAGETNMTSHTDMVLEVDILLGHFIKILNERNLYKDTIIVITSDNGGLTLEKKKFGHDAVGGLRGQKGSIWEGGHRVPMIVHWGDDTKNGSQIRFGFISDQVVGIHDLVPTFCEIAGVEPGNDQALDSISILPILQGTQDENIPLRDNLLIQSQLGYDALITGIPEEWRNKPFREYAHFLAKNAKDAGFEGIAHAIIKDNWKLVLGLTDQPEYFVNLSNDFKEESNLIADPKHKNRIAEYELIYKTIRKSLRSTPPLCLTTSN
jgi:arylsulfatase A-like enzyme